MRRSDSSTSCPLHVATGTQPSGGSSGRQTSPSGPRAPRRRADRSRCHGVLRGARRPATRRARWCCRSSRTLPGQSDGLPDQGQRPLAEALARARPRPCGGTRRRKWWVRSRADPPAARAAGAGGCGSRSAGSRGPPESCWRPRSSSIQVLIRRGHDAGVGPQRLAAPQPMELLVLEHPQAASPGSPERRRRSHRAAGCRRWPPRSDPMRSPVGPGEGAPLVSEELRLEQGLGQGGTVDLDERPFGPRLKRRWSRPAMSSLPVPVSPVTSTVERVGATRRARSVAARSPPPAPTMISSDALGRASRSARSALTSLQQALRWSMARATRSSSWSRSSGFSNEVVGAGLHGLDGGLHRAVGGHQQHARVRASRARAARSTSTPSAPGSRRSDSTTS